MCGPQAAATDGTIFARYDTSQVVIFEISSSAAELNEFIQVFGQRFVGLVDNQGVYGTYRVPNPEAPYPQDYVIDQQGIVRYWSDEYDPQEIIRIIDGLLATSVEGQGRGAIVQPLLQLLVTPNPSLGSVSIDARGLVEHARVKIYDTLGRCIRAREISVLGNLKIDFNLSAGEYFITLESAGQVVTKAITITK